MGCQKITYYNEGKPLETFRKNLKVVYAKSGFTEKKALNYSTGGFPLPGRHTVQTSSDYDANGNRVYRYGMNGQESDFEINNITKSSYTAKFWQYDSRLVRRWNLDPKPTAWESGYAAFRNNPLTYVDMLGDTPTVAEAFNMSAHISDPKGTTLTGGWEISATQIDGVQYHDANTGFKSNLYERRLEDGNYEYAYVTAGTDMEGDITDYLDWENNFKQILYGNSKQYTQSAKNAEFIDRKLGDKEVTYIGHSLGGGMASANALKTGRYGITFNAAGLSVHTRKNLGLTGLTTKIDAYIIKGELLHTIQLGLGLTAEGTHHMLRSAQSRFSFFGYEPLKKYYSYKDHLLDALKKSLEAEGIK